MAVQQIDRLTGASRHACWRRQFNTPGCSRSHDDVLGAICHASWRQEKRTLPPARGSWCSFAGQDRTLCSLEFKMEHHLTFLDGNDGISRRGVHRGDKII